MNPITATPIDTKANFAREKLGQTWTMRWAIFRVAGTIFTSATEKPCTSA